METSALGTLEEFNRQAALKREELAWYADEDRKRELVIDKQQQTSRDFDLLASFTNSARTRLLEIEEIRKRLDRYEAETVQALLENESALKSVNADIEKMMLAAETLPNGRRVFKTRDGKQVFDEFGKELDAGTIAPDQISDDKPHWNDVRDRIALKAQLSEHRGDLTQRLDKIDDMRDRMRDDDLSTEDEQALKELETQSAANGSLSVLDNQPEIQLPKMTTQLERFDR